MPESTAPQLLLIDDDPEYSQLMRDFLQQRGFQCSLAADGPTGLRAALAARPDMVLLDVMMPGMDGFAVIAELRRFCDTPVLMLTARGEPQDRISGLHLGADDYLGKPFHPEELIARIQAVLRRASGRLTREKGQTIQVGGVALDTAARTVTIDGAEVDLTALEYDILDLLMRAAGRPVTRDEISLRLYQRESSPLDRSIDVHLSHLRRKLGLQGSRIHTIRGSGYLFTQEAASR